MIRIFISSLLSFSILFSSNITADNAREHLNKHQGNTALKKVVDLKKNAELSKVESQQKTIAAKKRKSELKKDLSPEKKNSLINYKERYLRVFDKLKANGSIYALTEPDLDIVAGGLNDAIELIEDNLTDDLAEEENEEILGYKNDCQRLVDLLAS